MKCPKCLYENPEELSFCGKCGAEFAKICPRCNFSNPPEFRFCGHCGSKVESQKDSEEEEAAVEGERKHVTALFSDLSGYTALCERLDPEEVKEVMSRIFGDIAQVVTKYEGFIEKFVGDAVMVLFGVPKTHEDDPIRAIKTAREIHDLVQTMSPQLEQRVGRPLSMHTGINTGLVVTGEVDLERGTHGVAGDAINLAAHLSSLGQPGEILVGPVTYRQAEGYFTFEAQEPAKLKDRTEPVHIYRVVSPKLQPSKIHRLQGLRADLIGRKVEVAQLVEAVAKLREGKGAILSISGDAGTGKSRLVEEFKASLDLEEIQWREGHAYAYSQKIPYFPLIDLLNRAFQIEEGDPPEKIKEKVESRIEHLIGKREDIVPYIGSLFALKYPEIEGISPDSWRFLLQKAVLEILSALVLRAPTIICLEDLHWADPPSLDLFRSVLSEIRYPVLFLCIYRPPFRLITGQQLSALGKPYEEIVLQDLSPTDAQNMMESLLQTKNIPLDLRRFSQEKVQGNPFYLEEVINSLIEAETLIRQNGDWMLARSIDEADIPPTVHGVISARLDRLETNMKRVLQEASVIGKAFPHEILKRITDLEDQLDPCLQGLERLDLIRTRSLQPDLEYVFKHTLTQEVVYNGLLKKERETIHERIARAMEELFKKRLPEFYETLAFHFTQGQSVQKSVDYLTKSGEKSLGRYALEESHQYFQSGFDLLSNLTTRTPEEEKKILEILAQWALVFNYRGDFSGLLDILKAHENLAESQDEEGTVGMFYAWVGWAMQRREKLEDSYHYLQQSLKIGEENEDLKIIGYACAWLTHTCADLGHLDEAIVYGKRAEEICAQFKADHDLYRFTMAGIALAYYFRGDSQKAVEVGRTLIDYGRKHSDIRSLTTGYYNVGYGQHAAGDFPSAIKSFQTSIQVSMEPLLSYLPRLMLGYSYLSNGQLQEAENTLEEVMRFGETFGFEQIQTSAQALLGIILAAKGNLSDGLRTVEAVLLTVVKNKSRYRHALLLYLMGRIYLQLALKTGPKSLPLLVRNFGFLMIHVPFASKKAEGYFNDAIRISKEIGANGILGQALLNLGLLHQAKKRNLQARECFSEAITVFELGEAQMYSEQAQRLRESL
jgi:class 3 adenylate cyclase/tetratricopeptide (TPR) repeat protein